MSTLLVRLHEMQIGQFGEFYALLAERQKSLTRENKPYYQCRFKDAKRTVAAMVWADSSFFEACEQQWRVGQFYRLWAKLVEHKSYGLQIEVAAIRPLSERDRQEGFTEIEFIERFRLAPEQSYADLFALAGEKILDTPLKALVHSLLESHRDALMRLPASPRHYYPYPGGWLEHTLRVAEHSLWLAERYRTIYADSKPPLNVDVVLAGAILHEIGRVAELRPDPQTIDLAQPTVAGRLFGHSILGRDLIREAGLKIEGLNPQVLSLLEHLVLTHLSLPEWGSPRLPAIPEVLIVHHADDLDAKMEMFERCLRNDATPGDFTDRDPILGKHLWKSREL